MRKLRNAVKIYKKSQQTLNSGKHATERKDLIPKKVFFSGSRVVSGISKINFNVSSSATLSSNINEVSKMLSIPKQLSESKSSSRFKNNSALQEVFEFLSKELKNDWTVSSKPEIVDGAIEFSADSLMDTYLVILTLASKKVLDIETRDGSMDSRIVTVFGCDIDALRKLNGKLPSWPQAESVIDQILQLHAPKPNIAKQQYEYKHELNFSDNVSAWTKERGWNSSLAFSFCDAIKSNDRLNKFLNNEFDGKTVATEVLKIIEAILNKQNWPNAKSTAEDFYQEVFEPMLKGKQAQLLKPVC